MLKKVVFIGEEIEVSISGLGSSGEGVGHYNDFTIFVHGALPSERVLAKIILVKSKYAVAEIINILEPSLHRINPICSVYEDCGGCQLQHINYSEQLVIKEKKVKDAIKRIGHLDEKLVLPIIGAENPWHYRNKMMFPVGIDDDKKITIGCYSRGTHKVVNIEDCHIQHQLNNKILFSVKRWMNLYNIKPYDTILQQGDIRYIMGRVSANLNEIMVAVITGKKDVLHLDELVDILKADLPDLKSVIQIVKKDKSNVVLKGEEITLYGKKYILDNIDDYVFSLSAKSFFQVNNEQTSILYKTALEMAALSGEETVIEAYCGTGTISIYLSPMAKKVIGIEIVPDAVENAKINAKINKCKNIELICGDASKVLYELNESGVPADVIFIDPPRAGCDEKVIETISEIEPKKVVYISCNPATLARDLKRFDDLGYETLKIQPVDMFPMTVHVESVVLMSKKNNVIKTSVKKELLVSVR